MATREVLGRHAARPCGFEDFSMSEKGCTFEQIKLSTPEAIRLMIRGAEGVYLSEQKDLNSKPQNVSTVSTLKDRVESLTDAYNKFYPDYNLTPRIVAWLANQIDGPVLVKRFDDMRYDQIQQLVKETLDSEPVESLPDPRISRVFINAIQKRDMFLIEVLLRSTLAEELCTQHEIEAVCLLTDAGFKEVLGEILKKGSMQGQLALLPVESHLKIILHLAKAGFASALEQVVKIRSNTNLNMRQSNSSQFYHMLKQAVESDDSHEQAFKLIFSEKVLGGMSGNVSAKDFYSSASRLITDAIKNNQVHTLTRLINLIQNPEVLLSSNPTLLRDCLEQRNQFLQIDLIDKLIDFAILQGHLEFLTGILQAKAFQDKLPLLTYNSVKKAILGLISIECSEKTLELLVSVVRGEFSLAKILLEALLFERMVTQKNSNSGPDFSFFEQILDAKPLHNQLSQIAANGEFGLAVILKNALSKSNLLFPASCVSGKRDKIRSEAIRSNNSFLSKLFSAPSFQEKLSEIEVDGELGFSGILHQAVARSHPLGIRAILKTEALVRKLLEIKVDEKYGLREATIWAIRFVQDEFIDVLVSNEHLKRKLAEDAINYDYMKNINIMETIHSNDKNLDNNQIKALYKLKKFFEELKQVKRLEA